MRLEGQVAIVTGASRGIGEAVALALSREGAAVAVNGRNQETIKAVAEKIAASGGQALPVIANVSDSAGVDRLVAETLDGFQKIDILVNNAAVNKLIPSLELAESQWEEIIDVNLKGQFLCSRAVARHMIERGRGRIVNIASIGGHIGTPGLAAYCASKGGSLQLTRTLAAEWGKHNITVNAVSPGLTVTAMMDALIKEQPDFIEGVDRIPLRRLAKPEDIASAVVFLVSAEADYITGQEIIVDGGTTIIHPRLSRPSG